MYRSLVMRGHVEENQGTQPTASANSQHQLPAPTANQVIHQVKLSGDGSYVNDSLTAEELPR